MFLLRIGVRCDQTGNRSLTYIVTPREFGKPRALRTVSGRRVDMVLSGTERR
jgi:hypothetical protein